MISDIIFTEVRPQFPGPIEGSIDGGIEQSIVYAYGKLHNIEVVPIDWFDSSKKSKVDQKLIDLLIYLWLLFKKGLKQIIIKVIDLVFFCNRHYPGTHTTTQLPDGTKILK